MNVTMAMPANDSRSAAQVSVDRSWKGLYRVSGVLFIMTAAIWTVVTWTSRSLYSTGYPTTPAAYLQLVSQHQQLAAITWSLWIIADFLLIAPTIALYMILQRTNRTLALLGSMFSMLFNIYDICVTELNSLVLVALSQAYTSASTEAAKASLLAAAGYGYYSLPIQTVLSFFIGTFGYLLWCVPMYRSVFRRFTAFYGTVWCLVGIIGSAAPLFPSNPILGIFQFLCVPAVGLWFVMVGVQLYRYGQRIPADVDHPTSKL